MTRDDTLITCLTISWTALGQVGDAGPALDAALRQTSHRPETRDHTNIGDFSSTSCHSPSS